MSMKRKDGEKNQQRSFVEAARSLECDESEERFDAALKKVAAHKPPPPSSEKPIVDTGDKK
jgi:hypothetical protein